MKRTLVLAVVLITLSTAPAGASEQAKRPSRACAAAMKAQSAAGAANLTNDQELAAERATLNACKTRKEWLRAVQPYVSKDVARAIVLTGNTGKKRKRDLLASFNAYCYGNEDAPACRHHG